MAEPARHRQTKEAATDMFYLKPPRHISTLPFSEVAAGPSHFRFDRNIGHPDKFNFRSRDLPETRTNAYA